MGKTMATDIDIYNKSPRYVVFNGTHGTDWDLEKCKRVGMRKGMLLKLVSIEVYSSFSKAEFERYPGNYNSVCFTEIDDWINR